MTKLEPTQTSSDLTATERFRELLDERGVKWRGADRDVRTWFDVDGILWFVFEHSDGDLSANAVFLTPEQAIAATLGTGTCHLEEIEKDCDTASEYMLDREWCFDAVYRCSCGCRFGHVAHNRPRFCPNCGAKVVDE